MAYNFLGRLAGNDPRVTGVNIRCVEPAPSDGVTIPLKSQRIIHHNSGGVTISGIRFAEADLARVETNVAFVQARNASWYRLELVREE